MVSKQLIQKVVFVCPAHFLSTWATTQIAPMFNSQGNLEIRTEPADYTAVWEGESSSYYDYFSPYAAGITLGTRRYGFNLKVKDQREEIYLALKELATLSTSTGYANYALTTCFDYHRVDEEANGNLWAAYQRGYTIRQGKIMVFDGVGGSTRSGYINCTHTPGSPPAITEMVDNSPYKRFSTGFSVKFLEYRKGTIY